MTARATALRALTQLEKGRVQRLRQVLDRSALQGRDQALALELVLGVERNRRFLDFVLESLAHRGLPPDPIVQCALRLGAYQLLFLDGVPKRAAVHETVGMVSTHRRGFANALLRRLAAMVEARAADPSLPRTEVALGPGRTLVASPPGLPEADPAGGGPDPLALRHSLPDFLVGRWRRALGDAVTEVARASSAPPEMFLRACALHGDGTALAARLSGEGVACTATDHPAVVRWAGGPSPLGTTAFAEGWFVVQDPTAVRAAEAVAAAPGMTVVDLCAAPGTKTMLLAERVRPDGLVLAFDVDERRRQRIAENAARLGLGPWIRVVDDATDLPARGADAVLVDVPCSNTGVLARRVEVRRRLRPGTFAELAALQRPLLAQALGLCRPGGRVVYSTCSLEPEENAAVARSAGTTGRLEHECLTLPVPGQRDGGYFAVLQIEAGGPVALPGGGSLG